MTNPRINGTRPGSIDHDPIDTGSTPSGTPATARRSSRTDTSSGASVLRGPGLEAEPATRSEAQQRYRRMQQRAGATPGSPVRGGATLDAGRGAGGAASTDFDARVQRYLHALTAGETLPEAGGPELPHMAGREVVRQLGLRARGGDARLAEAIEQYQHGQPESLVHLAIERAIESVARDERVDAGSIAAWVHAGGDAILHLIEGGAEGFSGGAAHAAGVAGQVAEGVVVLGETLTAVAIVDCAQVMVRDLYRTISGHAAPSRAVIEGMARDELVQAARRQGVLEQRAEAGFDRGVRAAVSAGAVAPELLRDPAYAFGYQHGQQFRTQHGAELAEHATTRAAVQQARAQFARFAPSHAAPPAAGEHVVMLPATPQNTVGASIEITGD